MNSMQSSSNEQMMQQQQPMGGDPSISGRPLDMMSNNNNNQQILQPPPNTMLSMAPFPRLRGMGGGDQQTGGLASTPPPAPPSRCQIMNPFLGTPPLVPNMDRMQQETIAGSSIGQTESAFSQDIRHQGYLGILNLPPPFQVHPNLQSQIQAFQHDMGQQHMSQQQQPPGFLQGLIPIETISTMPDLHNSSHLLQPYVRQRACRRSRANRSSSIVQLAHEAPPSLVGGNGGGGGDETSVVASDQSREMPPTAQITVDSTFGDNGGATVAATTTTTTMVAVVGAMERLEDAKLKGLEENCCSIGENFECNICFQKANEAVVTCCGHLFCWPCLYRWLHIHSYHKECPVCKGAIDESTITPIYGRECSALLSTRGLSSGSTTEKIPPRPPAHRVESARQLHEREDRGREREQRERALEREQEREQDLQQSESRGIVGVLVGQPPRVGIVTTSIEEGGMIRDSASSVIQSVQGQVSSGRGGGGAEITISSANERQHQQEDIDLRASFGHEDTSSSRGSMSQPTGPPGVMDTIVSSLQDPTSRVGGLGGGGARATFPVQPQGGATTIAAGGGGTNSPSTTTNTTPTFLQCQVLDRREQLHAALAASARSGGVNSISSTFADRVDERRQMISAVALLLQEWEDVVKISQLVGPMSPVQAASWMAVVQGNLGSPIEGMSLESLGDFPSHPHHHQQQQHGGGSGGEGVMLHSQPIHQSNANSRHTIALPAMISHFDGGLGGEDLALSHLVTANPLQAGDWLAAMHSRLTSMEKIVENLDSPLQVLQQPMPMPTSLHLSLPSAWSSILQGGQLLQTSSDTHATGLEELSLLDSSVANSTTRSMEGPSSRVVEECATTTTTTTTTSEAPPSSTPPTSNSNTSTSTLAQCNAITHSEPRLHYQEAPIPKPPSSSRRRSSRTSEEGTRTTNNNNHNQGQGVGVGGQNDATIEQSGCTIFLEPMANNSSKRRRLD